MPTLAERLGRFAAGIALEHVPPAVLAAARRSIVDTTGVTLAGFATDTVKAATRAVAAACGEGACPVPGADRKLAIGAAAQVYGTAAHVWDFDDTCYEGIAHGSAVVWSAVAALAAGHGLDGRAALGAFVAGVETEYALASVVGNGLYFKGWWATGILGAVGAAAGAARALSLDADATANAIAIAAMQASGPRRIQGWPSKPWMCGRAAETGVTAALYARAGLTAPPDIVEHPLGYAALHADGRCDAQAIDDLGQRWRLVTPGVALKLYPACSAMQAATEAVSDLLREQGLRAADIEHVRCEVTELVDVSLIFPEAKRINEAQFSMPFAIGCMLRHGRFGLAELTPATLADPRLRTEMAKVEMVRSKGILAGEAAERDHPEGALVTITTTGGRRLERFNGVSTGMPTKPMPDEALDRKFLDCAAYAGLSRERAVERLSLLRSLEPAASMAGLYEA